MEAGVQLVVPAFLGVVSAILVAMLVSLWNICPPLPTLPMLYPLRFSQVLLVQNVSCLCKYRTFTSCPRAGLPWRLFWGGRVGNSD